MQPLGKQGTNGLSWTTADPVTGTTAINYSSEVGTLFTKEEEPLGQTLDLNDPAETPQPLPCEIKMESADDLQWRCEVQNYFCGIHFKECCGVVIFFSYEI